MFPTILFFLIFQRTLARGSWLGRSSNPRRRSRYTIAPKGRHTLMKFTDGRWLLRAGVQAFHPVEVLDAEAGPGSLRSTLRRSGSGTGATCSRGRRHAFVHRPHARRDRRARSPTSPGRCAAASLGSELCPGTTVGRPTARSCRDGERAMLHLGRAVRAGQPGRDWSVELPGGQPAASPSERRRGRIGRSSSTGDGQPFHPRAARPGAGPLRLRARRAVRAAGQERPGRRHLERRRRNRQRAGVQERPVLPDQRGLRRVRQSTRAGCPSRSPPRPSPGCSSACQGSRLSTWSSTARRPRPSCASTPR